MFFRSRSIGLPDGGRHSFPLALLTVRCPRCSTYAHCRTGKALRPRSWLLWSIILAQFSPNPIRDKRMSHATTHAEDHAVLRTFHCRQATPVRIPCLRVFTH